VARVELTRHLYRFFPHLEEQAIEIEADTIRGIVDGLERLAPGLEFYLCDERGRLRTHVNIFIGEERILDRARLSDRVSEGSRVFIMQALSGG